MFKKFSSKATAIFVFVLGFSIIGSTGASATPLTLQAGGSVATVSNPNNVLRNPLTNAVLIEITNSNSVDLFQCGGIVGIRSTAVDLSTSFSNGTVGSTIQSETNSSGATNFIYNSGTTYSAWCVGPTVSPYYFSSVDEIQLSFAGGLTGWALVTGPNTFIIAGESSGSSQSPAAAEAARQAAIAVAKVELFSLLKGGKTGTLNQYLAADLYVINEKTAERVNAAVLKLAAADRENIDKVKSIIKVENFIEQVSTATLQKSITALQVVELKLIPADSRNKASVTSAIEKAPAGSLTSMASVQAVVDAHLAAIKARKDRTAAIKAKIAAANK
jgi:hypothetical protein